MTSRITTRLRRLARGAAGCLLGGALMVPLGPTSTSQAVNQMNNMSMRPLPSADPRPVVRDSMVWVPDRVILVPGQPAGAVVPGHWERVMPEGDRHVPPTTVVQPSTGTLQSFPSGTYPSPDERPYGP
jgi:hypothetical protein